MAKSRCGRTAPAGLDYWGPSHSLSGKSALASPVVSVMGRLSSVASTAPDRLKDYRAKRNFARTNEPQPKIVRGEGRQFVVQRHDARRLHFNLRLELDGALLSWAWPSVLRIIPQNIWISKAPLKRRIRGGAMTVWDRGTWGPVHDTNEPLAKAIWSFRSTGKG